jgi:hypothetical protein
MICPCSSISCAECPTGRDTGAHPGISCIKYAGIREEIDSGRADAEYESYRYLLESSRPCPKCGMSIERVDGCNHMRCSQCQDYFCWECGGRGNLCSGHSCNKANQKLDYKDTDNRRTERDRLAPRVLMFRSYRVSHDRLQRLDKTIRSFERDSLMTVNTMQRLHCMLLERQIKQAMLWIRLFLVEQGTDAMLELCLPLQRLELLDHAHGIRTRMSASAKLKSAPDSSVTIEQDMGFVSNATNKRVVYRHQKTLEKKRFPVGRGFEELIADEELKVLCNSTQEEFHVEVRLGIEAAIKMLIPSTSINPSAGRQRSRKNETKPQARTMCSVESDKDNSKTSNRESSPGKAVCRWKGKDRVRLRREHVLEEAKPQARAIRSADTDEGSSESSRRESNPKEAACRWKGKDRVRLRREHAMDGSMM